MFFDVRVDNEPKGRITIQLYSDVPIGAQRFLELAEGRDGVSYRLSKIDGIAEVRPSVWSAVLMYIPLVLNLTFEPKPHLHFF